MPKLQCTYAQAHSAAQSKIEKGQRSGERQYECWINDKFQFKVSIPDSHGRGTAQIPIGTLKSIIRQLKLSRAEFTAWRDCPLDAKEYEDLMRKRLGLGAPKAVP